MTEVLSATATAMKAQACVQRCDHGVGVPLTLDECLEAVALPLAGCGRERLVEVVAYMAAQVVGYEHRADRNAPLAMVQIERVIADYRDAIRVRVS